MTSAACGAALVGAMWGVTAKHEDTDGGAVLSAGSACSSLVLSREISLGLSDGREITVFGAGTSLPALRRLSFFAHGPVQEFRIPIRADGAPFGEFVMPMPVALEPGTPVDLVFKVAPDDTFSCRVLIPHLAGEADAQFVPTGSGAAEEVPGGRLDRVRFTITAPPTMRPSRTYELDFWAHLDRQRREVVRRAKEAALESEIKLRPVLSRSLGERPSPCV